MSEKLRESTHKAQRLEKRSTQALEGFEILGCTNGEFKLRHGTAGTGVGGHFSSLILSQVTGIKIKHVPYKGGGEYIPRF
jgi:hypothetical protein